MRRALIYLNLYGCEAVRHKLQNSQKMLFWFSQKNVENWRFWKMHFFWVGHFEFFFCFFPMKISQSLLVSKDGSKFWSSQTWQHFLTHTKHSWGECTCRQHAVKNQECYNFLQTLANIASVKKKTTFGIYRTTYIKSDGLIAITELLAQDLLSLDDSILNSQYFELT